MEVPPEPRGLTLTLPLTRTRTRTRTRTPTRYHRSREDAAALLGSLDERGHNELSLKRVLDAEWSCLLDELANEPNPNPPVSDEWRPHGPHVGSRVSLHFDGLGAS